MKKGGKMRKMVSKAASLALALSVAAALCVFTVSASLSGADVIAAEEGDEYTYKVEAYRFYVEAEMEEPTCQAKECIRYDCSHIDDCYIETLNQHKHSFVSYEASATCEEGAYLCYTCIYCGESYTVVLSSPTGHVYIPTTTTATCTSPGGTTYTCMYCGDSYVVGDGVLAEHEYVTEKIVSPTCEEQGYRVLVCVNCGEERRDVTAALGHEWYVVSETMDSDGNIVRTYICSACGNTRIQTLSNTANTGGTQEAATDVDGVAKDKSETEVAGIVESDSVSEDASTNRVTIILIVFVAIAYAALAGLIVYLALVRRKNKKESTEKDEGKGGNKL